MKAANLLRLGSFGAAGLVALALCGQAGAQSTKSARLAGQTESAEPVEPVAMLEEVVVTAPSANGRLRGTPHSVSVISAADIERSTATGVADLLSREAGLNLQSYFGGDKNASIDMRGMGATASSNVQVLVDGVRLNEDDLSGADIGSLSLAQIERIEILRGGGSVRYGNGAVGGVINIITKRATRDALRADAQVNGGSYETFGWRTRLALGSGDWAGDVKLSQQSTDGYRQNGGSQARDAGLELRWMPTGAGPVAEVFARASHHDDHTGLPGPVTREAFYGTEAQRRASDAPFDFSDTNDNRATLGTRLDFGAAGELSVTGTVRDRTKPYLIGYSDVSGAPPDMPNGRIESSRQEWGLRHHLDIKAWGQDHSIDLGIDRNWSDYSRYDGAQDAVGTRRHLGSVDEHAYFGEVKLGLGAGWTALLGMRNDHYKSRQERADNKQQCEYDYVSVGGFLLPVVRPGSCANSYVPSEATNNSWHSTGADVGATWQVSPAVNLFASHAWHFRNPNIDELAQAAADLRPQRGVTTELGMRYGQGSALTWSATAFHMRNEDEIYYNALTLKNLNYAEPTRRIGAEAELRWKVLSRLAVRASTGWVQARFVGGDGEVPLVPAWTASTEVDWTAMQGLDLLAAVRYAGSRRDGNDTAARPYDRLPAYTVCDVAARVKWGHTSFSFAVNNVFDRTYSTLAYSETYYPMPGRNLRLTAGVQF